MKITRANDVGDFRGGQGRGKRSDNADDKGSDKPSEHIAHPAQDDDDESHHGETAAKVGMDGVDGREESRDEAVRSPPAAMVR